MSLRLLLLSLLTFIGGALAAPLDGITFAAEPGKLYLPVHEAARELGLVTGLDDAGHVVTLGGVEFKPGSLRQLVDGTELVHVQQLAAAGVEVSAPNADGTVRVGANSVLGISTSAQAVDFNGGTLEVRTDSPAGFGTRNLNVRNDQTGSLFVDHGVAGALGLGGLSTFQNQTVAFGNLRLVLAGLVAFRVEALAEAVQPAADGLHERVFGRLGQRHLRVHVERSRLHGLLNHACRKRVLDHVVHHLFLLP
jgi:hypothetical protein